MKKNHNLIEYKIKKLIIAKNNYITKLLNKNKNYIINFYKSGNNKLLGIYDNNNLLLSGKYNFYGIYQPNKNLWIWASSIPGIDKYHIININRIKSFDYLFELNDEPRNNFYYQLLTQDVLFIKNNIELEWINELLLYLSNDLFYFNPFNTEGNIQFLTLIKIKEKYI
jgi:hypothetical protein